MDPQKKVKAKQTDKICVPINLHALRIYKGAHLMAPGYYWGLPWTSTGRASAWSTWRPSGCARFYRGAPGFGQRGQQRNRPWPCGRSPLPKSCLPPPWKPCRNPKKNNSPTLTPGPAVAAPSAARGDAHNPRLPPFFKGDCILDRIEWGLLIMCTDRQAVENITSY